MSAPRIQTLYEVCNETWPAAATRRVQEWCIRDGQGGGQRVSCATLEGPLKDIAPAEAAMDALGQDRLFMVREAEAELDAALEARGYRINDPVNVYQCPVAALMDIPIPKVTAFAVWEPLHIALDIWENAGIGPSRAAVMRRGKGPKTSLLGRWKDHPAGAGFCAIHDGIAMVHALEILPHQRQQGMGKWMMRRAAFWAAENGASHISAICTRENDAANGLYRALGMEMVGHYHYRIQDS